MARVTDAQVHEILDTDRETTPFIGVATVLVDEELANSGLSAARLALIELYLAAHYVSITDPALSEVRNVSDSLTFHLPTMGAGFASTTYGQQAIALDTSGRLAVLGSTKAALFQVL